MYNIALFQMLIIINSAVASCWTVLVGFGYLFQSIKIKIQIQVLSRM